MTIFKHVLFVSKRERNRRQFALGLLSCGASKVQNVLLFDIPYYQCCLDQIRHSKRIDAMPIVVLNPNSKLCRWFFRQSIGHSRVEWSRRLSRGRCDCRRCNPKFRSQVGFEGALGGGCKSIFGFYSAHISRPTQQRCHA